MKKLIEKVLTLSFFGILVFSEVIFSQPFVKQAVGYYLFEWIVI